MPGRTQRIGCVRSETTPGRPALVPPRARRRSERSRAIGRRRESGAGPERGRELPTGVPAGGRGRGRRRTVRAGGLSRRWLRGGRERRRRPGGRRRPRRGEPPARPERGTRGRGRRAGPGGGTRVGDGRPSRRRGAARPRRGRAVRRGAVRDAAVAGVVLGVREQRGGTCLRPRRPGWSTDRRGGHGSGPAVVRAVAGRRRRARADRPRAGPAGLPGAVRPRTRLAVLRRRAGAARAGPAQRPDLPRDRADQPVRDRRRRRRAGLPEHGRRAGVRLRGPPGPDRPERPRARGGVVPDRLLRPTERADGPGGHDRLRGDAPDGGRRGTGGLRRPHDRVVPGRVGLPASRVVPPVRG